MDARAPRTLSVSAALLLAAGAALVAQPAPVFRASVEQVRVDVSVTRGGRPVAGLTAAQFEVRDNGVVHDVERVVREEVPLRLLLVLDTSSSLAGDRLRALSAGAQSLVRSLGARDEVGLVTFSQVIQLAVAPTTVHSDALAALMSLRAAGATAWRDALFTGMQVAGPPAEARPVALLFTDGEDTASWMDAASIVESVRRSGVVVHAVGIKEGQDRWSPGRVRSLQRAVEAGGGEIWLSESHERLGDEFRDVLAELRARYLLVYTPRETPSPGWHDVRVRLKGASGDVRARPGYFVATP